MGWNTRHLSVQFRREVGLPPSVVAGIFRARHAVSMLTGPDGLAVVAARAGYSDQSHMTRELRRYTGRTPAVLGRTHHLIGSQT